MSILVERARLGEQCVLAWLSVDEILKKAKAGKRYVIPGDSGKKALLAKQIAAILGSAGTCYFPISWGIWPSAEIPGLLERLRYSAGHTDGNVSTAAELMQSGDEDYLACVLASSFWQFWDFIVINMEMRTAFFASHDEWMSVVSENRELEARFVRMWNEMELPRFSGFK